MSLLLLLQGPPTVASSRTRGFAYLPYLERAGVTCRVLVWNSARFVGRSMHGPVPALDHLRNALRHAAIAARLISNSHSCRTIYVQKVILPRWLLRVITRGGRRLVFDYDDALYVLGPEQDAGVRAWWRRRRTRRFLRMLRASDVVIVENEPNRRIAEGCAASVVTITGPIDTARYRPAERRRSDRVVLGWVGSPSTTGYLRQVELVLAELVRRGRPIELHLVGAGPFESPHVTVRRTPWTLDGEVAALDTFDIGLMPLPDDPWTRGKGGYKILQYMAMGIPTVASPVGINMDLVAPGETGLLAAGPGDWFDALDRLVTDAAARQAMGDRARRAALARYSLDHYAPVFLSTLFPHEAGVEAVTSTCEELTP